jgi:hypothetical protein
MPLPRVQLTYRIPAVENNPDSSSTIQQVFVWDSASSTSNTDASASRNNDGNNSNNNTRVNAEYTSEARIGLPVGQEPVKVGTCSTYIWK